MTACKCGGPPTLMSKLRSKRTRKRESCMPSNVMEDKGRRKGKEPEEKQEALLALVPQEKEAFPTRWIRPNRGKYGDNGIS
ncbi:hypothetical protein GOP47_0012742 [Adiantum capillus-veneris]|uniref:Uncharacterized protein n=1 Tax=Adiantum capillus-veneris TaxID=13818 RepID=A0A9D4URH3_ADICA|nr:hypothetical protein GOP47_0012742 [Adiantum capillus-veneris]